jgi:hypothetical protein
VFCRLKRPTPKSMETSANCDDNQR